MTAIETVNLWGARFVDFALPMLVQSSLLILLLFALDLVLRNRVRAVVRYAIWLLVLIKLNLPPSFTAPTSPAYWLPRKNAAEAPPAPSPQVAVRYSDVGFDEARPLPSLPSPRPKLQFAGWLLLGWLANALVLMAWLARRSRSVTRTASQTLPASDAPGHLLDACRRQMGMGQRVSLKLSGTVSSPAVCGLWQPVILIPQQLADKLSALQLRAVLLHELAHIKRGDAWVNYAQTLLQIFYWWHPLLWLANARIRRVREQAVDEVVMVQMGVEAETYPATLLEVARLAFRRPTLALGFIGIVESKSALAHRIQHLLDRPVPKTTRLGFADLVAVILTGAALLPMARGERAPYQPPRVASEPGQQPAVVGLDVKFVEIEQSDSAGFGLGEPTLTEFNGHRAWALTTGQMNTFLQRALAQRGVNVLTIPGVTTLNGRPSQIQIGEVIPVEGTEIRVGPTCELVPYVSGELIDLAVTASVTERRPIDPSAPFASVADAFLTNDVGTARVIVGNGGGVVLENPEARSAKGSRYLVAVSATIVSADRAAVSQTLNEPFPAATDATPYKPEAQDATFQDTTPKRLTNSPNDQPTNAATGNAVPGATMRFASSTGQDVEIEAIKPTDIQFDSQTGICVVTNDSVVRFNGAVLTADRCQVNTKTGEVIAEGGVTLQRGDQVVRAERIQYNFILQNVTEINEANRTTTNEGGTAENGSVSPSASGRGKVPALGDLPLLGRLFRPDSTTNTPRRDKIISKLHRIVLPEVVFENTPLPEALRRLCRQACERDPEGAGVNFLLNPNAVGTAPPATMEPTTVDPITGKPITQPLPETLDMNSVKIRINPALKNVRLGEAIEAIVKTADKPIQYSIEDYAVVISPKPAERQQLETRVFRVNAATFIGKMREALKNYGPLQEALGPSDLLREFFTAAGVNVAPPNSVYFKDRTGVLMVRASAKELDLVWNVLGLLDSSPQQISIEAKFMEMPAEVARKIGLDLPPSAQSSQPWTKVLTAAQARATIGAAEQVAGVDILSAPKVTTLSGRQTQISVTQATDVKGKAVQTGPALEILPLVSEDGMTLSLDAAATVTDVFEDRSDRPVRRRKVRGKVSLYDRQTLVLANPMVELSRFSNTPSLTNAIPEEASKRLIVFITPTIIDPAGSPVHPPGKEPFPPDTIPNQPSRTAF